MQIFRQLVHAFGWSATKQMEVNVVYLLSCVFANVEQKPIASFFDAKDLGHFLASRKHIRKLFCS